MHHRLAYSQYSVFSLKTKDHTLHVIDLKYLWLIGSLRLGKNRVPRLFSLLYVKKAKSKNIVYGENLV